MEDQSELIVALLGDIATRLQRIEERVDRMDGVSTRMDKHTWILEKIGVMMNTPMSMVGWMRSNNTLADN
jgi:hypothetical protein